MCNFNLFEFFDPYRGFLRDPGQHIGPYDSLKFIPLNGSGTIYLSLGLESRTEVQYLNDNCWGAAQQNVSG